MAKAVLEGVEQGRTREPMNEKEPPEAGGRIPAASGSYQIYACGSFLVKRWDGTSYQPVPVGAWGGSHSPRVLLKVLLCSPGRQVSRGRLLELLWPGIDPEDAARYLSDAAYRLRTVLRLTKGGESFLLTAKDTSTYALAGQEQLWVDADAALTLLEQAEAMEQHSGQALPLLEEAAGYLARGEFLAEEDHLYFYGRRARIARARRGCLLALAQAYRQSGWLRRGETLLSGLLEENVLDEDALCALMLNLHQQGRTSEGLRLYEETKTLLEREGLAPTEATRLTEQQLRTGHQFLDASAARQTVVAQHSKENEKRSSPVEVSKHGLSQKERPQEQTILPILPRQSSFPQFWNIPHQRNPFFTGRDEILTHLHDLLNKNHAIVAVSQQALCGLGGIGKTQIALEYAYRYGKEYQAVFWIKADTRENLFSDFLSLATLLFLPECEAREQGVTITAIQRWLREHTGWLIIFDNADEPGMTQDVLPTGYQGHVILTTRAQVMGTIAHRLEIEEMDYEVGMLFLLRRAGIIDTHSSLEVATEQDRVLAKELVREFAGLPLALDQAGAYIEEACLTLEEYRNLYQQQKYMLLNRRGGPVSDHPEPVATTWALSFSRVEQTDTIAATILRYCAFLDPDAIPEEIFVQGAAKVHPSLKPLVSDVSKLHRAVEVLRTFSLIRRNAATKILTIHRLVQAIIQSTMDNEMRLTWAKQTIMALSAAFPDEVTMTMWPTCQRLLSHVQASVILVKDYHIVLPEAALLFNQAGYYLREQALYIEAESLYKNAMVMCEQLFGIRHPETSRVCYNLARLYFDTGQYSFSEKLHQQALSIREQANPPDGLAIALSLNSLAFLYYLWGINVEKAENLYHRALQLFEQTIGLEHPKTSHCLSNLALLYASQEKYQEARRLLLQVVAIREKHLGFMHVDTARGLQNLAWLYIYHRKQEFFEEAKQLLERALEIRERLLGPDHPQTAITLHHLALLYEAQERYNEAHHLYQRVLTIRRRVMGQNNPHVLWTEKSYAILLRKMEKPELAEEIETRIEAVYTVQNMRHDNI